MRLVLLVAIAALAVALAACQQPAATHPTPSQTPSSGANQTQPTGTPASFCGDGIVQNPDSHGIHEACDAGSRNGQPCQAPYGGTCTYCASNCSEVTVRGGYCGDGVCQSYESNAQCPSDCRRSYTAMSAPDLVYYLGSADLNGSGMIVNESPDATSTFTIALWVDQLNRTSDAYLVSRDAIGTTTWDGYSLAIGNAGYLEYQTIGRSRATSSIGDVPVGNWTHVAVTFNATHVPQLVFYIDGNAVMRQNGIDPPQPLRTPLLIGRRGAAPLYGFIGEIRDLRIYNTTLNATQIKALADAHP